MRFFQTSKFLYLSIFLGTIVTFPTLANLKIPPAIAQNSNSSTQPNKNVIARIWQGRTFTSKADKYYQYSHCSLRTASKECKPDKLIN